MRRLLAVIATLLTAATTSASSASLTGVVTVRAREGVTPAPAIVYAEPLDGAAPRQPRRDTLTQQGRSFRPAILAVPAGSTIDFPNRDLVFHNVFSLSAPEPFDLGLYRAGESRSRTFSRPGLYRVFCNIHPEMTAFIAVAPSPYVAVADAGGSFSVELPPGRYRVTALSERAAPVTVEAVVSAGASQAPPMTLDESQHVRVPHKNKFGQDYPPGAYRKP